MRISFDLDDTLICYQPETPFEPKRWWHHFTGNEPLRQGAAQLLRQLRQEGWEIWIYTTSYRPPSSIRAWLWGYGIRVAGIINQTIHAAHCPHHGPTYPPSKNPALFGIALHVDDSDGVRQEGEQFGFQVLVIEPNDVNWVEKVWQAVYRLKPVYTNCPTR